MSLPQMGASLAVRIAVVASGLFLMTGLLAGIWKYRGIMTSARHQAPVYVDITHRAALLYSFAALVLARLAEDTTLSPAVASAAVLVPLLFFASAIARYIQLAIEGKTDNQFERRSFATTWGIWMLIAGEVGGTAVLLWGYLGAQLR